MRMNNDLVMQALLIWHLLYGLCKPSHSPKCLEHQTTPHSPLTENLDNQNKFNGIMQKLLPSTVLANYSTAEFIYIWV